MERKSLGGQFVQKKSSGTLDVIRNLKNITWKCPENIGKEFKCVSPSY
jgi:hypothetical protein